MNKKGKLIVISAPSGCGKDTVVAEMIKRMDGRACRSISMTTRQIRPGEKDGVNYYYVSREDFLKSIKNGDMLEYTVYGSNYYGTPASPVREMLREGKVVFLIIEVEGGENVKKIFPDAVKIFIIPPSFEALEKRLRGRGTDSDDAIKARLSIARAEIVRADEYDYIVENDVLDKAVDDCMAIIRAEELKISSMQNKLSEVINNA
ncbi:MAG: guanylate kinase [Oscillospiraceae bacterium]|nr:guanylate kinase [Oscillospiraceae bacterium]MDD6146932.1 guanylate kinase [Oscillospiraceae bacterium]